MTIRFYLKGYKDRSGRRAVWLELREHNANVRFPVKTPEGKSVKVQQESWVQNDSSISDVKGYNKRKDKYQRVVSSHYDSYRINGILDSLEDQINKILSKLQIDGRLTMPNMVKEELDTISSKTQVIDLLQEFISKNPDKLAPGTLNTYKYLYQMLKEWAPDASWKFFDRSFPRRFRERFSTYHTNSIFLRLSALSSFLAWAYREGYTEHTVKGLWKLKKEETKKDVLTIEEIKAIYDFKPWEDPNIDDKKLNQFTDGRNLILWFVFSAMRVSEYLRLTPESYDQDTNTISFYKSKQKNGKQELHTIKMNHYLIEIWNYYAGHLPKFGSKKSGNDSATGTINRRIKMIAEHLGIEKNISSHTGRHTFATHMVRRSKDQLTVSRQLGHASLNTIKQYDKSGAELAFGLAEDINALLD